MMPVLAILACPTCPTCGNACDVSACHTAPTDLHLCGGGHFYPTLS